MIIEPGTDRYLRLLELHKRNDGLTAESVVADAADVSSPLHGWFEWDDSVAAREHRLTQARALIRSFRVEVVSHEPTPVHVRAFVHEPERGSYGHVGDVVADPVRSDAVRDRLMAECRLWAERARSFAEFADVVAAVDGLEVAA